MYVVGGFDGQSVLSSVEVLEPGSIDEGWRYAPGLPSPRSGLSAVATPFGVIVAGGFDGEQRLASVSKLDDEAVEWISLPPMAQPRSNFALILLPSPTAPALLAVGGYSGLQTVSHVELLVLDSKTWLPAPHMSINRSALKAVLLPSSLPTNILSSFIRPISSSE